MTTTAPALQEKIKALTDAPPLPVWHEQARGIPNLCLRSALFGVIQRGRRKAVKWETLMRLCGSECHRLVDFRRGPRTAMDELIRVEAVIFWEINDDDKLHVSRHAGGSSVGEKVGGIVLTLLKK